MHVSYFGAPEKAADMLGENIVSRTEFKIQTGEILKELRSSQSPLLIRKNDSVVAVVQDAEHYRQVVEALNFLKLMAQGEKEYQEGKGRDAEDVFSDALKKLAMRTLHEQKLS